MTTLCRLELGFALLMAIPNISWNERTSTAPVRPICPRERYSAMNATTPRSSRPGRCRAVDGYAEASASIPSAVIGDPNKGGSQART